MTDCPLNGRGQGYVSNFYILGLENFANKLVDVQLVDDTNDGRAHRAEYTSLLYVRRLRPSNSIASIFSGLVVQVVPKLL